MAGILGAIASGLTVAALFKLCVEAFDLIQAGRRQEFDLRKLILRLNIEKCRLYTWGEVIGLTTPANDTEQRPIDSHQFQHLVKETLDMILLLLTDSHKIQNRYGCQQILAVEDDPRLLSCGTEERATEGLAAAFERFKITVPKLERVKDLSRKTKWVIQDRKKFDCLIGEVKDLVDGLQDITSTLSSIARQEGMMRRRIQTIDEVEILTLVSDVCEVDHPDISDAASVKIDILSMSSTQKRRIEDWAATIDDSSNTDSSDIETMSITELKHRVRRLERSASKKPSRTLGKVNVLKLLTSDGSVPLSLHHSFAPVNIQTLLNTEPAMEMIEKSEINKRFEAHSFSSEDSFWPIQGETASSEYVTDIDGGGTWNSSRDGFVDANASSYADAFLNVGFSFCPHPDCKNAKNARRFCGWKTDLV